jgi:hypothetical protein
MGVAPVAQPPRNPLLYAFEAAVLLMADGPVYFACGVIVRPAPGGGVLAFDGVWSALVCSDCISKGTKA